MLRKNRGNSAQLLALLKAIHDKLYSVNEFVVSHAKEFSIHKTDVEILIFLINALNAKGLSEYLQSHQLTFDQLQNEDEMTKVTLSLIENHSDISFIKKIIDDNQAIFTLIQNPENLAKILKAIIKKISDILDYRRDSMVVQQEKERLLEWTMSLITPWMKRISDFNVALKFISLIKVEGADGYGRAKESLYSKKCKRQLMASMQPIITSWYHLASMLQYIEVDITAPSDEKIIQGMIAAQENYWRCSGLNNVNDKAGLIKMIEVLDGKTYQEKEKFIESHKCLIKSFNKDKGVVIALLSRGYGDISQHITEFDVKLDHFDNEADIVAVLLCVIDRIDDNKLSYLINEFMKNNQQALFVVKEPEHLLQIIKAILDKVARHPYRSCNGFIVTELRERLTDALISLFLPNVKAINDVDVALAFLCNLDSGGNSDAAILRYRCLLSSLVVFRPIISNWGQLSQVIVLVKKDDVQSLIAKQEACWKLQDEHDYRWQRRIAFLGGAIEEKGSPLFGLFSRDGDYVIRGKILDYANLGPKSWCN